jgi:arabinofuranosyltransferase
MTTLDRRWTIAAYICAGTLLVTFVVRTAWMCDDAYITARTIDNWLKGYGLRWNVTERVQTFTHPLWLLLEATVWKASGGFYWSSMALSIVCSIAAAIVVTMIDGVSMLGAIALCFLCTSQAFIDFATSGLETPLSYLLLATFLIAYLKATASPTWVMQTTALAALLALNRLDMLVLIGPALIDVANRARRDAKLPFLLGLIPLLAWEAFSFVYYGFPVTNTAYAKLATGIPQSELTTQGLAYLLNSWQVDPSTLIAILAALVVVFWYRDRAVLAIAGGLWLHVMYVVRVGGDFMSGRFLAPAVVVAVGLLLYQARTPRHRAVIGILMITISAIAYPHASSRVWRSRPFPAIETLIDEHGIADERLIYARDTGLLKAIRLWSTPDPAWQRAGRDVAAAGVSAMSRDSVGLFGYGAGPTVHIVDTLALCDPLLARLPADRPWRIGHFHRPIPAGYMEILRGRRDHLEDAALDNYYVALREITRGPLWSRARWSAILLLNTRNIRAPFRS